MTKIVGSSSRTAALALAGLVQVLADTAQPKQIALVCRGAAATDRRQGAAVAISGKNDKRGSDSMTGLRGGAA